jgi:hypothetical protein
LIIHHASKKKKKRMARFFALSAAALLLAAALLSGADAFTFDLPSKKYRCFTEEVSSNTWMSIKYAIGTGYAQVVDVKVTDSKGNVVHEDVATNKGSFETYSGVGGDYAICFYSRMSSGVRAVDGMKRTVRLEWRAGQDESTDYAALASTEHLRPLELHLRQMLDTTRALHGMYEFFKEREAASRVTNETIFSRAYKLCAMVIVFAILFGWWQVRHLKGFFRKKRLID